MILIYPVGIPGWYWYLLCCRDSALEDKSLRGSELLQQGEKKDEWMRAQQISDLWKPYKPGRWSKYYEVRAGIKT